jgi:ADP-ribose pyrophosphatase YjhB (NUDIX family)
MNKLKHLLSLLEETSSANLIFPESAKFAGMLFTHNNEAFFLCQPKDNPNLPDPRENTEITNPEPRGESLNTLETILGSTLPTGDIGSYGFNWTYPGGGIENGETPYDAALRECREEIGFVPTHTIVNEYIHPNGYHTFHCELLNKFDNSKIKLNNESFNYGWYGYGDLPNPLHDGVGPALDAFGINGMET